MSLHAYLSTPFSHASEMQSFDALVKALVPECAAKPEPHYLVGNVMFDGDELDTIYLKSGCISVIEMKNYGGRVHFSENGDWYAGDIVVGAHVVEIRFARCVATSSRYLIISNGVRVGF